jgi:hypothetical protein
LVKQVAAAREKILALKDGLLRHTMGGNRERNAYLSHVAQLTIGECGESVDMHMGTAMLGTGMEEAMTLGVVPLTNVRGLYGEAAIAMGEMYHETSIL